MQKLSDKEILSFRNTLRTLSVYFNYEYTLGTIIEEVDLEVNRRKRDENEMAVL